MTRDNNKQPIIDAYSIKATPFSYGAGHVRPNKAADPGLVYDMTLSDYLNFLCSLGYNEAQIVTFSEAPYKCSKNISLSDLNYPSIAVPKLFSTIKVTRTLKNVGKPGTYRVGVQSPDGILVSVEPKSLKFNRVGEEKSFSITLKVKNNNAAKGYVFGRLIWSDGEHYVRSPIVVKTER